MLNTAIIKPTSKNCFYSADLQVMCTFNCQCYQQHFIGQLLFVKDKKDILPQGTPFFNSKLN